MKKSKGFTLIEVLVVVGIIGVLASILLIGLGTLRRKGADTRRIADVRTMQNALELFATKCGYYPGDYDAISDTCIAGPLKGTGTWSDLEQVLIAGGVGITKIPYDPARLGGRSYSYNTPATGSSDQAQEYVLRATLDDSGHPALADDVDGVVFGIECDDDPLGGFQPNYCVRF